MEANRAAVVQVSPVYTKTKSQKTSIGKGKEKKDMNDSIIAVPGVKGDGKEPTEREIDEAVCVAEAHIVERAQADRRAPRRLTPQEAGALLARFEELNLG